MRRGSRSPYNRRSQSPSQSRKGGSSKYSSISRSTTKYKSTLASELETIRRARARVEQRKAQEQVKGRDRPDGAYSKSTQPSTSVIQADTDVISIDGTPSPAPDVQYISHGHGHSKSSTHNGANPELPPVPPPEPSGPPPDEMYRQSARPTTDTPHSPTVGYPDTNHRGQRTDGWPPPVPPQVQNTVSYEGLKNPTPPPPTHTPPPPPPKRASLVDQLPMPPVDPDQDSDMDIDKSPERWGHFNNCPLNPADHVSCA